MKSLQKISVGIAIDEQGQVAPASRKAVDQAHWMAAHTGATLTLVHSTWDEDRRAGTEGKPHRTPTQTESAALEALVEEYRRDGVEVSAVTANDRPWLVLTRRMIRGECDIVFAGRRDVIDKGLPLLGSNAAALLRNCPGPVWVVHPEHHLLEKRVLAATDLTEVGDRATQLAADVAIAAGCELHLVHAWQRTMEFQMESARLSDEEIAARKQEIEDDVRERILAGLGDRRGAVDPILHIGCTTPELAIKEGCKALDPGLVVMGTVSRTGIPGLLVGNTAEHLFSRLDVSLLTVKPEGFASPVTLDD